MSRSSTKHVLIVKAFDGKPLIHNSKQVNIITCLLNEIFINSLMDEKRKAKLWAKSEDIVENVNLCL